MKGQVHDEDWVKKEVKKLLKKYDIWYFMPSASRFGKAGIPDFVCCKNGKFLVIETKRGDKQATELQQDKMDEIAQHGGTAMLINESNLEHAEAWLRDL